MFGNLYALNFFFPYSSLNNHPWTFEKKKLVFQQAVSIESGAY